MWGAVAEWRSERIPLVFYRTAAGSEPVRDWLKGLDEAERQAIGKDLLRAQWGGRWACLYGVDPTVVSPAAIWIIRAIAGAASMLRA
jgi:hypothetical protein